MIFFCCNSSSAAADAEGSAAGAEGASPAAAAPAAEAAGAMKLPARRDVNDFTTWTSNTWALLDWDSVAFPSDPAVNVASVRYCLGMHQVMRQY